jgi:hypothetical protein
MIAARAICREQDRHLAQAPNRIGSSAVASFFALGAGRAMNTQINRSFEVFLANFAAPIP